MIFTDAVIKAIESANLELTEADMAEYAYWKLTIRKDMKVMISGKSRMEQFDILIKWYATTREYKRFLPVARIIDEYHMKTVRARFDMCDKFWDKHEEDESEWFWQSVIHDDSITPSMKNVADAIKTARDSLMPIYNDVGALMVAEQGF